MTKRQPTPADLAAAERLIGAGFPKTSLTGVRGYCMLCRMSIEMHNPVIIRMQNGKPAVKGDCPNCAAAVFKIGLPDAT